MAAVCADAAEGAFVTEEAAGVLEGGGGAPVLELELQSSCREPTAGHAAAAGARGLSAEQKGQRLIEAAREGSLEELRWLLAAGACVEWRDGAGWGPLHHAAMRGHADAVRLLAAAGAGVDARNDNGWTPLYCAVFSGHAAAAAALLAAGADRAAETERGRSPLGLASDRHNRQLLDLLTSQNV